MASPIEPFLEATVRTATPLALAALGEAVTERAGLINIGLEGAIIAGAFGALVGAGAALVFGAASALQYLFQAMGWALPYQLFLALPYVLTLIVLAAVGKREG